MIVRAIRDLSTGSKRQTLLYMGEVFKGANTAKIRSYHHDRSPYYGKMQSWALTDIHRLLHMLVLNDFLSEEMIFVKDIPQAYLRLGSKVDRLMTGGKTIEFALRTEAQKKSKKTDPIATTTVPAAVAAGGVAAFGGSSVVEAPLVLDKETVSKLAELKDSCHNDLLDVIRNLAAQRNVTLLSIMNMQAIKAMAETMPETEEEMLLIPHVTQANFIKFGRDLLTITQQYAAEKLCNFFFFIFLILFSYDFHRKTCDILLLFRKVEITQFFFYQYPRPYVGFTRPTATA